MPKGSSVPPGFRHRSARCARWSAWRPSRPAAHRPHRGAGTNDALCQPWFRARGQDRRTLLAPRRRGPELRHGAHEHRRPVGSLWWCAAVQVIGASGRAARAPVSSTPRRVRRWLPVARLSASICSAPSARATGRPAGFCDEPRGQRSCAVNGSRPAPQTTSPLRLQVSREPPAARPAAPEHSHPSYLVRHSAVGDDRSIHPASWKLSCWKVALSDNGPSRTSPAPSPAPTSCATRMDVRRMRTSCSAGSASCAPCIAERSDRRKAAVTQPGASREGRCAASPATPIWRGRAPVAFHGAARRRVG